MVEELWLLYRVEYMFFVQKINPEVFAGGTRHAMPKTICAPDTSSLKTGSGATEGDLDYGGPRVSGLRDVGRTDGS